MDATERVGRSTPTNARGDAALVGCADAFGLFANGVDASDHAAFQRYERLLAIAFTPV